MQIDTGVLFPLVSVLLAIAGFIGGRMSNAKQSGKEDGELKADIKYIKGSVDKQEKKLDKVVENYDDIRVEMEELKGRLTALEQKVEMLHGGS